MRQNSSKLPRKYLHNFVAKLAICLTALYDIGLVFSPKLKDWILGLLAPFEQFHKSLVAQINHDSICDMEWNML